MSKEKVTTSLLLNLIDNGEVKACIAPTQLLDKKVGEEIILKRRGFRNLAYDALAYMHEGTLTTFIKMNEIRRPVGKYAIIYRGPSNKPIVYRIKKGETHWAPITPELDFIILEKRRVTQSEVYDDFESEDVQQVAMLLPKQK